MSDRRSVERIRRAEHVAKDNPLGRGSVHASVEQVQISSLLPSDSPRLHGVSQEHVRILAEVTEELPPIVVHRSTMQVIDGMHRLHVAALRGQEYIGVQFFEGTRDEAFVLAVKLNLTHGLPLSSVDRKSAADRFLRSHPTWSDRAIALAAGVSDKTVAAIRRRSTSENPHLNSRLGRDGRMRPTDPTEGRRRASEYISEKPDASLREIAHAAGIAVATAQDVRRLVRLGEDPVVPRQQESRRVGREERLAPHGTCQPDDDHPTARPDVGVAVDLRSLRRDPSLRFSEAGRAVLRLLDIHLIDADDWRRLGEQMPAHCTNVMAELAHQCASAWLGFARQLELRGQRELSQLSRVPDSYDGS
jgi:ParB-like chromosome segregation protein Spo0J